MQLKKSSLLYVLPHEELYRHIEYTALNSYTLYKLVHRIWYELATHAIVYCSGYSGNSNVQIPYVDIKCNMRYFNETYEVRYGWATRLFTKFASPNGLEDDISDTQVKQAGAFIRMLTSTIHIVMWKHYNKSSGHQNELSLALSNRSECPFEIQWHENAVVMEFKP